MTKANSIPYYISMAVYLVFNALIYFGLNQTVTGTLSDVYLGATAVTGLLAAISVVYIIFEDAGEDASEADVELLGITFKKWVWYVGCIVAIGARLYFAYDSNHNATGGESVWGAVWFISSLVLLLMTWGNAKKYFKNLARLAQQRKKEEAAARATAAA